MGTIVKVIFGLVGLVGYFVIPTWGFLTCLPEWHPALVIMLSTGFLAFYPMLALIAPNKDGRGPISRFWHRMEPVLVPLGALMMISFPLWIQLMK